MKTALIIAAAIAVTIVLILWPCLRMAAISDREDKS